MHKSRIFFGLLLSGITVFGLGRLQAEDASSISHRDTITVTSTGLANAEADEVWADITLTASSPEAALAESKLSKLTSQLSVVLNSDDDAKGLKKPSGQFDLPPSRAPKQAEIVQRGLMLGMRTATTNWRGNAVPAGFFNTALVSLVFHRTDSMSVFMTYLARMLDRLSENNIVSSSDPEAKLMLRYATSEPGKLRDAAYANAFSDATQRAGSLATLAKRALTGKTINIREDVRGEPAKPDATKTPETTSIEARVQLTVEFELGGPATSSK